MRRCVSLWFLAFAATFAVIGAAEQGSLPRGRHDGLRTVEPPGPGPVARTARPLEAHARVVASAAPAALAASSTAPPPDGDGILAPRESRPPRAGIDPRQARTSRGPPLT